MVVGTVGQECIQMRSAGTCRAALTPDFFEHFLGSVEYLTEDFFECSGIAGKRRVCRWVPGDAQRKARTRQGRRGDRAG